jgi:hypothetical protein
MPAGRMHERTKPIKLCRLRPKSLLEKNRLILTVEGDLKPNTSSGIGNWLERDWFDFVVIQPKPDTVHGLAEGTFRPFFDANDEREIERHNAPLPLAREAGARRSLSRCLASG